MTADERLAEVFDRGLRKGPEALNPLDRELFHIQNFIVDYEMDGLSAYFYNRLPDLNGVQAAVAAMRKHGMLELAKLLGEAADLFAGYTDPSPPCTWNDILKRYDPEDRLGELEERIRALGDYGLREAHIE